MTDDEFRARISIDPTIMVGQPCIRGTRLPARHIVQMLAHGFTYAELIEEYPRMSMDDIQACLLYAVDASEREFAASQGAKG